MNALRAATLGVTDVDATSERYASYFDYVVVEHGTVDAALAGLLNAPALVGRRHAVLRPASGADVFIRLVQAAHAPGYRPLRTHGWAALELCVQDVLAMHERLRDSPFEIIGPPRAVSGLPSIHPMQVQGPDAEIIYLTEIKQGGPGSGLPTARSAVDTLFIIVAGCSDITASARWFERQLGLHIDPEVEIPYRMLARAFELPPTQLHRLTTATFDGDICLELDQYPAAGTPRVGVPGELPPGIGLCTFALPSLDRVPGPWLSPPAVHAGAVYGGGRAGTLLGPDGMLVELVERPA
jgi:hypothetical protein